MKQIKFLLERIQLIKPPAETVKKTIQSVLKKDFNIFLPDGFINFNPPNVNINIQHSVIRNEILINKEKILDKIKSKIGIRTPLKINFVSCSTGFGKKQE